MLSIKMNVLFAMIAVIGHTISLVYLRAPKSVYLRLFCLVLYILFSCTFVHFEVEISLCSPAYLFVCLFCCWTESWGILVYPDSGPTANLGIALGNPWIDPKNQYDVSEFAHGLGLISIGQKNKLQEQNK